MNYTQSFEDFAARSSSLDLALYAGIGVVLWVLFKDRMSPVQSVFKLVSDMVKSFLTKDKVVPSVPVVSVDTAKEDVFFQLVASWKQTRDLAVLSGCEEAVKVADQMFPFLSPTGCVKEKL